MPPKTLFIAACALALLGAGYRVTVYDAPAGSRAAGANPAHPFDAVLPNGRIVAPVGNSVTVGINALGVALTPDGHFAIVSNSGGNEPGAGSAAAGAVRGGASLTVVNASSMRVSDVYSANGATFFVGVRAVADPATPGQTLVLASAGQSDDVLFFTLDGHGRLTPAGSVAIPGAPGPIAISPDRRTAYVVNTIGDTVSAIDLSTRSVSSNSPVGYAPYDAIATPDRLYVTDPGLMRYAALPAPVRVPAFANVPPAPAYASALTTLTLAAGGALSSAAPLSTAMDQAPDGVQNVGGAHPTTLAISKSGRYAYVCMTNVDRIAVVDLTGTPRVVGGLQLRLFDRAPYGALPDAIVRSPDGKRLYVTLAGLNTVAVIDSKNPARLHRLGLIPTGWFPSALAISSNGRYLYVANANGVQQWASLQRIDLRRLPLQKVTLSALRYNRTPRAQAQNDLVPPLRSERRSTQIRHVVFILEEDKSYDSMLGDLTDSAGRAYGNGDPALAVYGRSVTPNLHSLAREFALATNLYADGSDSSVGRQFAAGGIATAYAERTRDDETPEEYPRSGYLFNSASRAGLTYRDYGGLLRLRGYANGLYTLDVPALASLDGHADASFPAWNPQISDVDRAKEFLREFAQLQRENAVPDFTYVSLPGDGATQPGTAASAQSVADGDRALGMIVGALTHGPEWSSTAIFITPADAQSMRDHVNPFRTYAVVVSPYAKRHYAGAGHLSTVSIVKTEEELLGLPPLSLGDLLASDMASFFTATPDPAPFDAVAAAAQTGSLPDGQRTPAQW